MCLFGPQVRSGVFWLQVSSDVPICPGLRSSQVRSGLAVVKSSRFLHEWERINLKRFRCTLL